MKTSVDHLVKSSLFEKPVHNQEWLLSIFLNIIYEY